MCLPRKEKHKRGLWVDSEEGAGRSGSNEEEMEGRGSKGGSKEE